jgi:hypothetical protein
MTVSGSNPLRATTGTAGGSRICLRPVPSFNTTAPVRLGAGAGAGVSATNVSGSGNGSVAVVAAPPSFANMSTIEQIRVRREQSPIYQSMAMTGRSSPTASAIAGTGRIGSTGITGKGPGSAALRAGATSPGASAGTGDAADRMRKMLEDQRNNRRVG